MDRQHLLTAFFCILFCVCFSNSQTLQTGTIKGIVKNDEGVPIFDATVKIKGKVEDVKKTDKNGRYLFDAVPVGKYEMKITKVYFSKSDIDSFIVNAGQDMQISDVVLSLSKEVAAIADLIDKDKFGKIAKIAEFLEKNCENSKEKTCKIITKINTAARMKNFGIVKELSVELIEALPFNEEFK